MTPHQRFQAAMNFKSFDRLPLVEWAPWWDETLARWYTEGLPTSLTDNQEICQHFGLDLFWQDWVRTLSSTCPHPASHGAPLISNMSDYEAILPHLYPDLDAQTDRWKNWEAWAKRQEKGEAVLWFTLEGYFWFPRMLLGIEPHLYAFCRRPEL